MKPSILICTAAAMAAVFVPTLEAKPDKKHPGQGQASAKAKAAPKVAAHAKAQPQPMRSRPMQLQAQHANPKHANPKHVNPSPQIQQQRSVIANNKINKHSGVANNNKKDDHFRGQNQRGPTIAFGGNVQRDNNDRNVTNERNVNIRNEYRRGGDRYNVNRYNYNINRPRVPEYVFRDWDRGRVHAWNHHNYRWYGNDWVIIDGGYGPDYGYDYYSAPSVSLSYGVSDNVAASVQERLSRRGYDTGGVDGVVGPQTRSAIAAFQEDRGLPVTGRIDQRLLGELGL